MFNTIRSKILMLVIGLMLGTLMTFIFITKKNYQTEISHNQYKLAKETLTSTIRMIDHEYNDLLSDEINFINNRRSLMKDIGAGILSMVDSFYDQQKAGFLTEQSAKKQCLKRLKEYRYDKNNYFFVCDFNLTGLSHPNNGMQGIKWYGFEDLKKMDALTLIQKSIKIRKQIFTVFMWPRLGDLEQVKQLVFFMYFPQWEWIIGTSYEMGDIERIFLAKEKQTLSKVNNILGRKSLNEIGGVLIFDSQGQVIIHTSHLKKIDLSPAGATLDKSIQDPFKKAAKDPEKPVEYIYTDKNQEEMIQIAYAEHYRYMDWYITVFIDKNELKKPGSIIAGRYYVLLWIVLAAGIIVAIFISKKITRPIALLAQYSRNLPGTNFTAHDNSFLKSIKKDNQNNEISQLVDAFSFMETRLEKSLKELGKRSHELSRLNEHIFYIEEKERKAFAADLHDSVAQTLALSISKIKNLNESGRPVNLEIISEIQKHLELTVDQISSMIYQLSPPVLDDFEIDIALEFLIEESNEKYDIDIKYIKSINHPIQVNKSDKIILYRAVNELIMNIIKHSRSKDAQIEISKKEALILLRVEDKGVGFDLNKFANKNFCGFGIYSISERIKNLGGNFELFSKPGKGTKILFSIPLGPTQK